MVEYDVIIVGAGPAGLFAAETLSSNGCKVTIFDKGRDIEQRICPKEKNSKAKCQCQPCNIYAGLGGAGGKSDGKLNFHPLIGGDLFQYTSEPKKYIQTVDDVFTELSGVTDYCSGNGSLDDLVHQAYTANLTFVPIKLKHIGSDRLVGTMQNFRKRLTDKKVVFHFLTPVEDLVVENGQVTGVSTREKTFSSKYVVLSPGRESSQWFERVARKYKIDLTYLPIDIGVRVETINSITNPITNLQYDPKIKMLYRDDLIRNFCTNPRGFVVTENYGDYFIVNGHAENERKSQNCNFAILYRLNLTEPVTNTTTYGINLAKLFNDLGNKRPIVQRLEDLKSGRRSKPSRLALSNVKPTLVDAIPGDIALAMPPKIMQGILEYLERLNCLMPGINHGNNTLLYAPEIKFQSMRGEIDSNFESQVKNLFFAGDGCGLSGGIVPAAVTGILAAEGMMRK